MILNLFLQFQKSTQLGLLTAALLCIHEGIKSNPVNGGNEKRPFDTVLGKIICW